MMPPNEVQRIPERAAITEARKGPRLLVERIVVGRDESGNTSVRITYRLGPPEPSGAEDEFVSGVKNACSVHAHHTGTNRDMNLRMPASESSSWRRPLPPRTPGRRRATSRWRGAARRLRRRWRCAGAGASAAGRLCRPGPVSGAPRFSHSSRRILYDDLTRGARLRGPGVPVPGDIIGRDASDERRRSWREG
jgi:hypothetical protein